MSQMQTQGTNGEIIGLKEWEQRKEFVGFTEKDARLLREFQPIAEDCVDAFLEELYKKLLQVEETKSFFPDETMLNRVRKLQKTYFLELTAGDYGESYLNNRLQIGRIHYRIGLSPRWYIGTYSIYQGLAIPRLLQALKGDYDKMLRALSALIKIIQLDQELAITTYITSAERVITQQSREILAISTPVVQMWEGILVAPLIGTLDSQRTEQFMERLLESVVKTNSQVALVDITGVPTIDTQTAQYLIEAVNAVKLLGAQVVLTGICPAIAQTLVHLGIELTDVVTCASLAAGVRYALKNKELNGASKNESF